MVASYRGEAERPARFGELHRVDDGPTGSGGYLRAHHHHDYRDHPHQHGRRGGRARRGESKYLLMDALTQESKHGYEIIKSLEARSGGQYAPSPGVVYPTLQFLAEAGLVRAQQDGDRRVFHLTDEGRRELGDHADEVAEFWSQFVQPRAAAARAEVGFLEEDLDSLAHTVRGGLRGDPDAELVRSVRQMIETCRGEIRRLFAAASTDE